ncbi:glycosyltransferase [Corticibacterium sp. UT-5YL-CI-8]|nr:glycosyltransferase [Tianweitania sp. UT-5YL-CI-8]
MKDENIQPNALLWISPIVPDYGTVLEIVKPRLVVADLIDDQRLFPGSSKRYREQAAKGYEAILRDADVVFTNCEPLKTAFNSFRPDIHVVPNGCDILLRDIIPDTHVARLPRPIIGYVGNLRDRINLPLLERIAKTYPDGSIVLVGSAHGRPEVNDLAARNPNIKLLGVKPYEQAVSIIKAFDVAIMPHLRNEQTDHMNPLKLYVYFAAGAPIVTSEVANINDLASHIQIARDDDDFLANLASVLRGKTSGPEESSRQDIIENLSWARRVDAIWRVLARPRG